MRPRCATRVRCAILAGLALALAACGGEEEARPEPERLPGAASYIPAAPAPQPSPTPAPGALPDEGPLPAIPGGGGDAAAAGCGEPEPPPVSRLNVKVHSRQADRVLLDATPLVGPDAAYCRRIGYTDGRSFCPVRPEGHPEREACEAARVGRASDTGRPGPTWSANGARCTGPGGSPSCLNHAANQYQAYAYGAGRFEACAAGGACGEVVLP